MKYLFYCTMSVLLISSCGRNNIIKDAPLRLVSPNNVQRIAIDPTFNHDFQETLFAVDIITLEDSVMLLYDALTGSQDEYFYKAYSLSDFSYLGRYCTHGRGDGEFLSPDLSDSFRSENGNICGYISDIMQSSSFSLDFTCSLQERKNVVEKISDLPDNTLYAFPYRDSLQFVMSVDNDRMLCRVLDRNAAELVEYVLYPDDVPVERSLMHLGNCVAINSERGIAAMVMLSIPQINFLDIETGEIFSSAVNGKYRKWKSVLETPQDMKSIMNSIEYYSNATFSSDYIIAVYPEKTMADLAKSSGAAPHIHVFDWDGNFLYDFIVEENISKIAFVSSQKLLYGLDTEGRVIRYDLSGIL